MPIVQHPATNTQDKGTVAADKGSKGVLIL
jgi:hypothetical protein